MVIFRVTNWPLQFAFKDKPWVLHIQYARIHSIIYVINRRIEIWRQLGYQQSINWFELFELSIFILVQSLHRWHGILKRCYIILKIGLLIFVKLFNQSYLLKKLKLFDSNRWLPCNYAPLFIYKTSTTRWAYFLRGTYP